MNLLIIGAPGTGKGTMSNLIIKNYPIVHISTGDMLREAVENKTPVGLKANEYMTQGKLVPDSVIHDIIIERLSKDDIKKGFLFDGYPRTLEQAKDLEVILQKLGMKIDCVINLSIDEEILKTRITGRRVCSSCGEIYHITNMPSKKEGICDKCGSELYQRKDDTLESLKTRLEAYHSQTEPLLDYYKNQELVHDVDADGGPQKVFERIEKILEGVK